LPEGTPKDYIGATTAKAQDLPVGSTGFDVMRFDTSTNDDQMAESLTG
jgi:hypothetical protein